MNGAFLLFVPRARSNAPCRGNEIVVGGSRPLRLPGKARPLGSIYRGGAPTRRAAPSESERGVRAAVEARPVPAGRSGDPRGTLGGRRPDEAQRSEAQERRRRRAGRPPPSERATAPLRPPPAGQVSTGPERQRKRREDAGGVTVRSAGAPCAARLRLVADAREPG